LLLGGVRERERDRLNFWEGFWDNWETCASRLSIFLMSTSSWVAWALEVGNEFVIWDTDEEDASQILSAMVSNSTIGFSPMAINESSSAFGKR
jgi:hypothetical protein